jgi:hypothetical protein
VVDLDREGAIRRWSQDYEFVRSDHVAYYLHPRGLGPLAQRLSEVTWNHATTGALAAQRFAPIGPARQVAVYVEDVAGAAGAPRAASR